MADFKLNSPRQRKLIFDKYGGRCAYCGEELLGGWHIDHITPKHLLELETVKGLDIRDYCNPSCPSCNISKGGFRLEVWRQELEEKVFRMNRDSSNYRILKRFGLIQETGDGVIFYFERPLS